MRVGNRLAFVRASILSAFRRIWKWQTILPRQLLLSPLRLRFRKTDRIVDCSILPVNPSAVETVQVRPSTRPPSSMTTATSRWFCGNHTGKATLSSRNQTLCNVSVLWKAYRQGHPRSRQRSFVRRNYISEFRQSHGQVTGQHLSEETLSQLH